jgi:hypothetical protein
MNDTIIVSYDDHSNDVPILIVGRKRLNESTEIINAFDGDEAKELYERLVTVKGDLNG